MLGSLGPPRRHERAELGRNGRGSGARAVGPIYRGLDGHSRRQIAYSGTMKKDECEKAIRHLCGEWARDAALTHAELEHPSFSAFKAWLSEKGYSRYLDFRSVAGSDYDAELWFDQEFKQTWRR